MANFELSKLAAGMLYPGNTVEVDDTGLPSVLVYIPKFKLSDVLASGDDSTHPAFIVNGKEIDGFYYSKYQNDVYNGVAYSLPGETPAVGIKLDKTLAYCEAKGHGWHLSTAAEWAAIALWCKKNGFLPYGNNTNGKDSRESNYKAVPAKVDSNGMVIVATGTGPLTWSHDKTLAGIWDMNGNVWERQSGIRTVWGELQILANNDAADPDNPQNATSTCWKAISAADGSLVEPESKTTDTSVKTSGNTVKLDFVGNYWTYSTSITAANETSKNCYFSRITCDGTIGDAAKQLLRALALLPDEGAVAAEYESDLAYWINGVSEALMCRGGNSYSNTATGLFSFLTFLREASGTTVGFRAAYIPGTNQ